MVLCVAAGEPGLQVGAVMVSGQGLGSVLFVIQSAPHEAAPGRKPARRL